MSANTVFIIIFVIFIGMLFVASFISKNWVKESDDYILAGRQISTPLNVFGVIAIGFAGTTIALAPGFSVMYGLKASLAWGCIYALCGLALFGILYSNFIRRCGAQTLPEFLEMRFDSRTRSVVAITSVIGMCGILANNIVSCVNNICAFTGWNSVAVTALIFAVIIAFVLISGMWAISMTDFVQVILGIIVVPAVFFIVAGRYGWFSSLAANWPTDSLMNSGLVGSVKGVAFTYPSILNFVILFAAALVWGNNYYWMKVANCRNEKVAKKSFVWAAILLVILFMIPLSLIGAYVAGFDGSVLTLNGGKVAPTGAYGYIASTLFSLFGSLAVIGSVAAAVSTSATAALGASAVMTRDIYSRLINPKAEGKKMLKASKVCLLIVGIFTFVLCQFPGGPTYLFAFANCWLVPPAILLGLGMVWKKFNSRGAFWGALCGMVSMAVLEVLELTKIFVVGNYMYLATLGFIITLIAAVVASLAGKPAYFGDDKWERVPTATNRENVKLEPLDYDVLKLIRIGHLYMADITDYLGLDSKISNASIERLDRGGYITREGLTMSKLYTFHITDKGVAAVGDLEGKEKEMASVGLTDIYVELLKNITVSVSAQQDFIKKHSIRSMQMAAITSHLTRQGYILEKGIFQRKLEITEKGKSAVQKYAA
ncbi:MAG: sodium:solute symporter family protein [Oscillospiraceae bacterium]|nr:sodium:solute symporter family protein [Oscillospiraceae bacterium]